MGIDWSDVVLGETVLVWKGSVKPDNIFPDRVLVLGIYKNWVWFEDLTKEDVFSFGDIHFFSEYEIEEEWEEITEHCWLSFDPYSERFKLMFNKTNINESSFGGDQPKFKRDGLKIWMRK